MKATKIYNLVTLIISLLLVSNAFADIYKNDKFPPETLIAAKYKTISACNKGKYEFIKIHGKFKLGENHWKLYYGVMETKDGKKFIDNRIELKKLDTNIWVMECKGTYGIDWGYVQNVNKD